MGHSLAWSDGGLGKQSRDRCLSIWPASAAGHRRFAQPAVGSQEKLDLADKVPHLRVIQKSGMQRFVAWAQSGHWFDAAGQPGPAPLQVTQ